MSTQRDIARNEHTQNIKAGLPILKQVYGLTMDEYDYVDTAIDMLRDVNTYGLTEYMAVLKVDASGNAIVPCNLDLIDAVTTLKMGLKVFNTRVRYDLQSMLGNDSYFTAVDIMASALPNMPTPATMVQERPYMDHGLAELSNGGRAGVYGEGQTGTAVGIYGSDRGHARGSDGYITYQLKDTKTIAVDIKYAEQEIVMAYTGISVDQDSYPLITRKQANAIAVVCAYNIILKRSLRGDQGAANSLGFLKQEVGRMKQAAAIPENITENDIDQVLDAKTSFNRKSYRRPSGYSR